MSTLYLLNYNNYYNRIIKKFDTLAEYQPYVVGGPFTKVNFHSGDGIDAQATLNFEGTIPNYVLIVEDTDTIVSRWFVIECAKVRKGQYKLTLYRDTIADNYDAVKDATAFIEKATLEDNDPLIFNNENMTFNQIKTSELMLKDRTNSAWIVGYVQKKDEPYGPVPYKVQVEPDIIINGPLTSWEYYDQIGKTISSNFSQLSFRVGYNNTTASKGRRALVITTNNGDTFASASYSENPTTSDGFSFIGNFNWSGLDSSLVAAVNQDNFQYLFNGAKMLANINYNLYRELSNLANKVISYEENGITVFKKVVAKFSSDGKVSRWNESSLVNAAVWGQLYPFYTSVGLVPKADFYYGCEITYSVGSIQITLVDAEPAQGSVLISPKNRVLDAPYDMFCIPYGDIKFDNFKFRDNEIIDNYVADKETMLNVAIQIGTALGGSQGFCYDIQLLPYFPANNWVSEDGKIDIGSLDAGSYSYIVDTSGSTLSRNIGIVLYPQYTSFTTNINLDKPVVINNTKVESLTDMYRLCSPNYASNFEFNAAKNGGIQYFNVDCTYMPINPYIHINPNFGRLYGKDFDDSRGLVCGGEFSLPIINDAWVNYQLNNKNYMASFNRTIENMEVKNKYGLMQDIAGAVTGTATGAIAGGVTGSILPGLGAVGGAIAGGITSAIGGGADIYINQQLRKEELDYTKDQFGFQLGNIQAMPQSLARTTAYTYNNKIFPFLEYYTCTEEEKQALRDKLYYNGMTVGRIGKIGDYVRNEPSYIKGKIIRLEIEDDFHNLNAIASEFNKGFFI